MFTFYHYLPVQLIMIEQPTEENKSIIVSEISEKGVDYIKNKESLKLSAYICPGGKPTIGWGSTRYESGKGIKLGDKITKSRAEELLRYELKEISIFLNSKKLTLTQNQYDALISFIYNVGISAFNRSTLFKLLKENNYEGAAKEFLKWNKVTRRGKRVELKGLTIRRTEEANIFRDIFTNGYHNIRDYKLTNTTKNN